METNLNQSDNKKFSNFEPPEYIYINFFSRSALNMFCRGLYLVLRCLYISLFY